jgi:hypothetical protein
MPNTSLKMPLFRSFAVVLVKNLPFMEPGDLLRWLLKVAIQHFLGHSVQFAASKSRLLKCRP